MHGVQRHINGLLLLLLMYLGVVHITWESYVPYICQGIFFEWPPLSDYNLDVTHARVVNVDDIHNINRTIRIKLLHPEVSEICVNGDVKWMIAWARNKDVTQGDLCYMTLCCVPGQRMRDPSP